MYRLCRCVQIVECLDRVTVNGIIPWRNVYNVQVPIDSGIVKNTGIYTVQKLNIITENHN